MVFIAGVMLSWPALVVLLILGVLFEHNEARGWAVFTAMIVAATAYFSFAVPFMSILLGACGYIVVGLIWSFYRYKRHAMKTVEQNKDAGASTKKFVLERLHPKAMLSTITAWMLIWPFSMISNVSGDLINLIQLLVTKFFRGVYYRIYDSAVDGLK